MLKTSGESSADLGMEEEEMILGYLLFWKKWEAGFKMHTYLQASRIVHFNSHL